MKAFLYIQKYFNWGVRLFAAGLIWVLIMPIAYLVQVFNRDVAWAVADAVDAASIKLVKWFPVQNVSDR